MVYGDGAFKDPVGKIWELADPVVSPAYTSGLEGQPNELKLKYLADKDFASLSGEDVYKRQVLRLPVYGADEPSGLPLFSGRGARKRIVCQVFTILSGAPCCMGIWGKTAMISAEMCIRYRDCGRQRARCGRGLPMGF